MTIPALNLYQKFGDPYRLVEFRLFSFNKCSAGCKNCFYQKNENDYYDFEKAYLLAVDMQKSGYVLETCYIHPTDVFENEFNYTIFEDENLIKVLNLFKYVGFASILKNGFDRNFFDLLFLKFPNLKIELHVNLIEEKISESQYIFKLQNYFKQMSELYGENILINLALNTGTDFNESQIKDLKNIVELLSHDCILEMNFTFLFNPKLSLEKKTEMMQKSYPIINVFSDEFEYNEQAYNERTLLRKPAFVFKDSKIYLTPILPFDEYVFVDEESYVLHQPTFDSFLNTYSNLEKQNVPLWEMCDTCEYLAKCQGKSFFSLANFYNLNCLKKYNDLERGV